jgi:hypothetical protein
MLERRFEGWRKLRHAAAEQVFEIGQRDVGRRRIVNGPVDRNYPEKG